MKLELTHEQLDYLVFMIEKHLEKNDGFRDMDSDTFMDMLHDLYSKSVVLQGNSYELKTR